jgi:hypothetical protein
MDDTPASPIISTLDNGSGIRCLEQHRLHRDTCPFLQIQVAKKTPSELRGIVVRKLTLANAGGWGSTFAICDSSIGHVCVNAACAYPSWSCPRPSGNGLVISPAFLMVFLSFRLSTNAKSQVVCVALRLVVGWRS